jgi:hypothetical protein
MPLRVCDMLVHIEGPSCVPPRTRVSGAGCFNCSLMTWYYHELSLGMYQMVGCWITCCDRVSRPRVRHRPLTNSTLISTSYVKHLILTSHLYTMWPDVRCNPPHQTERLG